MNFTKTVLPNGLRLIMVPMAENKTVTAMVLVEAGSRYETKDNNGISHFLEHMCFKGTTKRPSALAIATEFEKLGAHYNAFTAGSYTGYYGKVASAQVDTVLDIVSDLYLGATLPASEIEKEKSVIVEEINMYADQPQRIVWDTLEEMMYENHPLGRTVIGTKETVNSITHEALLQYRRTHYVPGKTVVIISGGFDSVQIQKTVEGTFGKVEVFLVVEMEKIVESQKEAKVKIFEKKTDQTHFVLGFRSFSTHDDRVYAGSILRTILGSGMSSRLFQKIREELGLCYYIHTGQKLEQDCGVFTIAAGVSNNKIAEAVSEIVKEIKKFLAEGPTDEEMQKAKDYRIGGLYLGLETSDQFADWYGFQEIEREPIISPKEHEAKLLAVTKEEVIAVAKEIFDFSKVNLAIVGPHDGKESALLALLA